jgi:CHAD domain-containing protein
LLLLLEELAQAPRRHSSGALEQVRRTVQNDRDVARNRLAARLPFDKVRRLVRRLRRAVNQRQRDDELHGHQRGTPAAKHAWVWPVDARLTRRASDVRSAIEIAGGLYVPERLHDVRFAVKKLRYAMELGAESQRQRGTSDIEALKAAQESA